MGNNDEENLSIKKVIMAKVESSLAECVKKYSRMSTVETEFTDISASSDPVVLRKAIILAKDLLKQRDQILLTVFELNTELFSEVGENWNKVDKLLSDFKLRTNNSGEATKAKFRHITDTAISLTKNYAIANPHHLNYQKCARGVTAALIKKLRTHFMNKDEQEKASLIDVPTDTTIRKHLKLAFAELGFPEYRKPKKMFSLKDIDDIQHQRVIN